MDEEKDFLLIEEYLDRTLQDEALADFELRLKDDKALQAELALYQEVDERLKAIPEKQQLRKEWTQVIQSSNLAEKTAAKKRSLLYYLPRVAAAALLLILAYVFWPQPASAPQLAQQYWTQTSSFQYAATDRSTANNPDELALLKEAYQAYQSGNFTQTKKQIEQLGSRSDEVVLLQGAANFQSGEYSAAISLFQQVLNQTGSASKDEARWYLALSYLAQDERAKAIDILQAIVQQQSWKHQDAKKLLEQIL